MGVRVVRRFAAAEQAPRFYLEVQPARDLGRPILLFQTLGREESTLVLSMHDLKPAVLRYLARLDGPGATLPPDLPGRPAGRLETSALPPCRYRRGAYITGIPSPRLIAGTATVESARVTACTRNPGRALAYYIRNPRGAPLKVQKAVITAAAPHSAACRCRP